MMIRRSGFSMMELLVVILVGSVVLAMGTRQFSAISNQRAVSNASNALVQTASRARSEAMRSGRLVYMRVRPDLGRVRVDNSLEDLHTLDMSDYGVTMNGTGFTVCYAARGYALPGCTTFSSVLDLGFARGGATAGVKVMPLGQVRRSQ
ncbi:MAG TPA: prepilin-type N-terminal cleavage/methylation domain-containing protein [Longimicrobiales bacterium]|nr:prepilin-type N-terminal cleavage/methylation domain-containing protein [Longimicrobiales bacterium]